MPLVLPVFNFIITSVFCCMADDTSRYFLVNKNLYVRIGCSPSYFYDLNITKDTPEDLHHVQRPQPSWQDDLVSD